MRNSCDLAFMIYDFLIYERMILFYFFVVFERERITKRCKFNFIVI